MFEVLKILYFLPLVLSGATTHLTRGGDAAHSLLEPSNATTEQAHIPDVAPSSALPSPPQPIVRNIPVHEQTPVKSSSSPQRVSHSLHIPVVQLGSVTARPKPPARPLLPDFDPLKLFQSLLAEPKVRMPRRIATSHKHPTLYRQPLPITRSRDFGQS